MWQVMADLKDAEDDPAKIADQSECGCRGRGQTHEIQRAQQNSEVNSEWPCCWMVLRS